jgi:hypothetical protein
MEPATPTLLFGYFDFLLLAVIILFNFLMWRYEMIKVVNWKVIALRGDFADIDHLISLQADHLISEQIDQVISL